MEYYSLIYGKPSKETLSLYSMSLSSFCAKNPEKRFTVFVSASEAWAEIPSFPNLSKVSFNVKEGLSPFEGFLLRYCDAILGKLPDEVCLIDLDIIHTGSIDEKLFDLSKINGASDTLWEAHRGWVESLFQKRGKRRPTFYFNGGLLAFNRKKQKGLLTYLKEEALKIKEGVTPEPFYSDQDIINEYLNDHPEEAHEIPRKMNYVPPRREIYEREIIDRVIKGEIVQVHVTGIYKEERLRVASAVYNAFCLPEGKGLNLSVVIISKNQKEHLVSVISSVQQLLPTAKILVVLDRDPGDAEEILKGLCVPYVLKESGWGFDAGGSRNLGSSMIPLEEDVLFLDGDRHLKGNMSLGLVKEALARYDVSLLKVGYDSRKFFSPNFEDLPLKKGDPIPYREDTFVTGTYTCGILLSGKVRRHLTSKCGGIFVRDFEGRYGEEDSYLGALLLTDGFSIGCFPSSAYLTGHFGITPDKLEECVVNREKYRIMLQDLGYTTYFNMVESSKDPRGFVRGLKSKTEVPSHLVKALPAFNRPIKIYYHVYQGGDPGLLGSIVKEQVQYLRKSSLWERFTEMIVVVTHGLPVDLGDDPRIKVRRGVGAIADERMTLQEIYEDSQKEEALILYWHTKGATSESDAVRCWRRFLMDWTVSHWEHDAPLLLRTQSVIGPSFSKLWNRKTSLQNKCFFGGNFWWTTSEHIRTLQEPLTLESRERFVCEDWVTSNPKGLYMNLKSYPKWDAYHDIIEEYL